MEDKGFEQRAEKSNDSYSLSQLNEESEQVCKLTDGLTEGTWSEGPRISGCIQGLSFTDTEPVQQVMGNSPSH